MNKLEVHEVSPFLLMFFSNVAILLLDNKVDCTTLVHERGARRLPRKRYSPREAMQMRSASFALPLFLFSLAGCGTARTWNATSTHSTTVRSDGGSGLGGESAELIAPAFFDDSITSPNHGHYFPQADLHLTLDQSQGSSGTANWTAYSQSESDGRRYWQYNGQDLDGRLAMPTGDGVCARAPGGSAWVFTTSRDVHGSGMWVAVHRD